MQKKNFIVYNSYSGQYEELSDLRRFLKRSKPIFRPMLVRVKKFRSRYSLQTLAVQKATARKSILAVYKNRFGYIRKIRLFWMEREA